MNQNPGSPSITADQLRADAAYWQNYAKLPEAKDNSLRVRTFNQIMKIAKEQPIPQMLFGKFWFEGELLPLPGDLLKENEELKKEIARLKAARNGHS